MNIIRTMPRIGGVIKAILRRPRMLGGLLTSGLFWALLLGASIDAGAAGLIAIAWLSGLAIGGNAPSMLTSFRSEEEMGQMKAWTPAFWVSLVFACATAAVTSGLGSIPVVLGVLTVPLALCYGICKVACWSFGCCGYGARDAASPAVRSAPLQLVEAGVSFGIAFTAGVLLVSGSHPAAVFLLFVAAHAGQRLWSTYQRRPLKPAISSTSSRVS